MPQVQSQGLNIHYEVIGDGPPLLLHHGTMHSGRLWDAVGYVAALRHDFKLILIDARGHGDSDKPHDLDAYKGENLAGDALAVLDDLGIQKTRFWGYSLGARVGFEIARIAPHRVGAYVLGGGTPFASDLRIPMDRADDPILVQEAVLSYFGMSAEMLPESTKPLILQNDFIAVRASLRDRPNIEDVLDQITAPCLIYVGTQDARLDICERTAARIPGGQLVRLPGLNHRGAWLRSYKILPHVRRFLETADTPEAAG